MQDARIWQVQTEICLHFACSKRKEKCRVHRIDSIQPKLITSTCFIFSSIPWSVSLSEIRTSNNLKWHSCDIVRCTTWWGTFRQIIPFTGWWWASYDFCDELVMIRMQNQLWSHWVVLVYHGDEFTKSECDFFLIFRSWRTGTWMKWYRVPGPERCTQKYICSFACGKRKK